MPEDTYYLQMEIQLTTAADKVLKEMGELLTTVTDQLKDIQKATEDFSKNASKDLTITNEQFKQLKKINQEISDQQDEYQKIKTAFDKDQKGVREDAIKFSEKTLGTVDRLQESYQGLGKDLDNIAGKYAESAKSSIDSYRQQEAAIASYKSGVEKGGETISTAMSDAAKSANGISQSSAEATESISGIGGDTTGLQKFAKALGLVSGDIGSLGKDTPGLNIFGKVLKSVGIDIGSLGKDTPGLNIFGKVLKSVGIDIGSLGKNASGLNTFDKNVKDTSDNIRSLGKDTPGLGVFSKVLKAVGIDVSGFTKQTGAAGESAAGITGGAEEAQEVMGGLGKTAGVAGAALLTLVTGGAAAPALLGAIGAGGGAAATGAAAAAGAAGKAGAAMGGMGAAAGRAAGAGGLGQISDWFGGIGKIIKVALSKFIPFFQDIAMGFALIEKRAENFRTAMFRATGSMNDMAFQATKLETGIIGSSKEIDEMIGSLAQAGAKGEELYNITKTTTVLNRAMGTSAAISAKFMMNVTRISGSSKQAAAMMGLMHNAAAKFGLSGKDMDEVMQHIVTSARQLALYGPDAMKKYTEGILAAVAAAKELGMETSKALEIMDKTKDPTGYAGLFGGKTFLMSAEQKQKELIKMGPELAERMKNLKSEAEKNRFMVEMGARMDINPREVPDAIALLQKTAEKEKIMIKTGLTVKETQKQIDNIVKKAQDASTGVVTLAATIQQRIRSTFMMIAAPLLNIMKPILTFFLGLADLIQALVAPIAEALSTFTGFLDTSEKMTDVFKSLMVPISNIGKQLAIALQMFLMPIALVFKTIQTILWAIWLVLKPIFTIFWSICSMVSDVWLGAIKDVYDVFNDIINFVLWPIQAISDTIIAIWSKFEPILKPIIKVLMMILFPFIRIITVAKAIIQVIKDVWAAIFDDSEEGSGIFEQIGDAISGVMDALGELWDAVKEVFTFIYEAIIQKIAFPFKLVYKIISGVLGFLLAPLKLVKDFIVGIAEAIKSWFSSTEEGADGQIGIFERLYKILDYLAEKFGWFGRVAIAIIKAIISPFETLAGWVKTFAGWFGISMDEGAKKQEETASSAVQSQQEYADESEKIREKSIRDAAKQQQQNMKYMDDNTKRAVSHSNKMVSEQQKEYIKLQEKALKTTKDKKERENIKAEIKEAQFVKQTADVTVNLAKKSREQAEVKAGMVPGETSGAKTIPSVKVTEGGLPVKPKEDVKLREETKKSVDRLGQLIEVVTRIADDKKMYELIKSYVTDSGDKPSDTGLARIANQWMT